jgi:hypothetical protein
MNVQVQERLREAIDEQQHRLRASVPPDRQAVILALLRTQDRCPSAFGIEPRPDLVTGRRFANLGGNKALQLCFEATDDATAAPASAGDGMDGWAGGFLEECGRLTEAELVLAHAETGFMRLADDGQGTFDAWIATKRTPTSWRERADIDWWASWLVMRHEPELRALRSERPDAARGERDADAWYRRVVDVHLAMMAYQLGYPIDAVIDGCTVQTYRNVLGRLIGWALRARDRGEAATPRSEHSVVSALASSLGAEEAVVGRVVAAFTLDRASAAYHAAVPGVASAPLVRIAPGRLVWSVHGLTTEPLFFLTRELKRRAAQEYHNTAYLREGVFRQELYALFGDKRFVTSPGRIELRRTDGDVRTDIDAVVFDRKTGTLGVFELKSQAPFARSTAELGRQRDTVLYANRQLSGVLAWLNRYGGDALLGRVDSRTAKFFRVQKVYPFVLGRYLAHFSNQGDGPEPDRRAAWGTWPQVLRLLDGQPVRATDANPLGSLFTRLTNDLPLIRPPGDVFDRDRQPPREIALGAARLTVHPSYAAFQASAAGERDPRART